MNPYSSWLNGSDPMEVIRSTPDAVVGALAGKDPDTPWAPGKWSRRQILAHLV
jgi:hypothetical protein